MLKQAAKFVSPRPSDASTATNVTGTTPSTDTGKKVETSSDNPTPRGTALLSKVVGPSSQVSNKELNDSLRNEICWLEARLVRHVEEVTAGSEATQNLLRNELKQELERVSERHSVQLSKGEAAHMELVCRLDEAEKRMKAAQQDQLTEIVSLRSRLEAVISERLSCKVDDSEQRLKALQQEQLNEIAVVRARTDDAATAQGELSAQLDELRLRLEEENRRAPAEALAKLGELSGEVVAASAERGDLRQKVARLQTRLEEDLVRLDSSSSTLATRLEAVERQVVAALSQAMTQSSPTAAMEGRLSSLASRIDAAEERAASSERTVMERSNATNPATDNAVLFSHLTETRTIVERIARELNELRDQGSPRKDGIKQDDDTRQLIARTVGEMDAELRVELASRLAEARTKIHTDLQADLSERILKVEENAIVSIKASLGAGYQAALSELCNHVRKLQAAQTEVKTINPRLNAVETELRGTARLVTSLANRMLEDKQQALGSAGSTGFRSPAEADIEATPDGMMKALESVIRGALGDSSRSGSDSVSVPPLIGKGTSIPPAGSLSTTADMYSDRDPPLSLHNGSEGSYRGAEGSEAGIPDSEAPRTNLSEGLMESLQGLAQAIDKTLGRPPTLSPEPSTRGVAGVARMVSVGRSGEPSREPVQHVPLGSASSMMAVPSYPGSDDPSLQPMLSARGRSPVTASPPPAATGNTPRFSQAIPNGVPVTGQPRTSVSKGPTGSARPGGSSVNAPSTPTNRTPSAQRQTSGPTQRLNTRMPQTQAMPHQAGSISARGGMSSMPPSTAPRSPLQVGRSDIVKSAQPQTHNYVHRPS